MLSESVSLKDAERALTRLHRAIVRGTGCYLTPTMVAGLNISRIGEMASDVAGRLALKDTPDAEKIAELRAAAEKATPGEWEATRGTRKVSAPSRGYLTVAQAAAGMSVSSSGSFKIGPEEASFNATHIANCDPQTVLALLDEVEALRGALAGMLRHSCVADTAAEDKDAEDHDAERAARRALSSPEPTPPAQP